MIYTTNVPHPHWATHAMRFDDIAGVPQLQECIAHAKQNAPGGDYGIRQGLAFVEWFSPSLPNKEQ